MYTLIVDEKSMERMNLKDMERTRNNALSEDPEFKFTKKTMDSMFSMLREE